MTENEKSHYECLKKQDMEHRRLIKKLQSQLIEDARVISSSIAEINSLKTDMIHQSILDSDKITRLEFQNKELTKNQ